MKTTHSSKRRSFIKAASALGILPFVSPVQSILASPLKGFKNELVINGSVITAAHWGALKVTMRNGKIVKSGKALHVNNVYNDLQSNIKGLVEDTRVAYPMVRKSYLEDPKNPKPELRGRDEWVQVSYEKALNLAADAIKRTIKKDGNEGLYGGSYGWQSSGRLHVASTLLKRFLGTIGGFTNHIGDYSTGASQVILPHVLGTIEVYEQQTSWPLVLENSKTVVIWGANPMVTLKISWSSTDESGIMYFKKLREKMKKGEIDVIIIDPVYNETAKFFKLPRKKHIAPVQGTDTALMLGMMHYLYSTKNYDKNFMDNYTVGFDKFIPYLLGKSDGVPKTPKWAEGITGIKEEVIKSLALQCFKTRSMIMSGWSMQRQDHGEQPHFMMVALACMIGQIGLEGGGFGLSYHYSNGGNPTCAAPIVGGMGVQCSIPPTSKWSKTVKSNNKSSGKKTSEWLVIAKGSLVSIPLARVTECILNPGRVIDFNGQRIKYPKIGLIYWCGGNPIVHQQQTNRNLEAFRSVDTVIVNEIYFTPTARMADIIFPVTTPYERNDITMTGDYSQANIVPMKACVARVGESRSDYEIFSDLSERFGTRVSYTDDGKSELDWIKSFYAMALEQAKGLMVSMPSFEKFWSDNKPLTFHSTPESRAFVRYKDFREDPVLSPLGTPSGLIEIYSETIAKMHYDDCGPMPMWIEPIEWSGMGNKPARFSVVSCHPRSRLHSQQNNTSLRKTYAISGREPIWINYKDAKELGIKTGDIVRVYNARGQVLAGAKVTKDIRRDTVRLQEGAWYDPMDDSDNTLCINGCVNVLTIDKPTSKLADGNIGHTALVNIEKYNGKAPRVRVFDRIRPIRVEK